MKKMNIILALSVMIVFSSCGTYTGTGTYVGASMGGVVGSAIGGISGGYRGSNIGTLVGMASGAAAGAAIGSAADRQRREEIRGYHERLEARERAMDDADDTYAYSNGKAKRSKRSNSNYRRYGNSSRYGNGNSYSNGNNSYSNGSRSQVTESGYNANGGNDDTFVMQPADNTVSQNNKEVMEIKLSDLVK